MNGTKLSQLIIQSLCQKIVYDEIPESGKLPSIRALADEYMVSTVIIREAVIVLETLGIVRIEHGKGIFLVQPDNLIEQLFNTRRELERIIIQDVARTIGDEDLAFLQEQVESMDVAAKPPHSTSEYSRFDFLFHGRIIDLSDNFIAGKFLFMIRSSINTPSGIFHFSSNITNQNPEYFVKSSKFHWDIFYALKAREPEEAMKAADRHEERVRSGWKKNIDIRRASAS